MGLNVRAVLDRSPEVALVDDYAWAADAGGPRWQQIAILLEAGIGGVFPRTAGFNSIDYGAAAPETLMITNILMFIGGGSAGTAGGIKISTFLVLGFAIWNEVPGRDQVTIAHRSISSSSQRQALSVALLGIAAVVTGTMLLLMVTDYSLEKVLFESISAFATVAVASAIALSSRPRLYSLPEERPIIG